MNISPKDNRIKELRKLHQVFLNLLLDLTDVSGLHFTSSFSRLSYLISTKLWTKKTSYLLHSFRKAHRLTNDYNIDNLIELGHWANGFIEEEKPARIQTNRLYDLFKKEKSEKLRFEGLISIQLTDILRDDKKLIGQRTEEPFDKLLVSYGDAERNEDFTAIIEDLEGMGVMPINILLHEVEVDENGLHSPNKIILDPDYLHIVTSISECFTPFGTNEVGYILRKLLPHKSSAPLIIGNVANYFLDRLINDPELSYEELLPDVFSLDLMGLSLLKDVEIRSLLEQCKLHFEHLKKVVNIDLSAQGLRAESTYIEPTFYSIKYGIQGRLDLFYKSNDQASIVELKSGSPFKVNTYGLNSNHYHQTLLYDMLIESVYGYRTNRKNFILYSKENNQALRYAPTLKVQQRETILQRNRLYLLDRHLERTGEVKELLSRLLKENVKSIKGYTLTEIKKVLKTLERLDDTEYAYVKELLKHLSKEQYISKIGDSHTQRSRGLSSLWRDTIPEKVDQFNIINHLTIVENYCAEPDPLIYLRHSEHTVELHNFRVGDLCILYAYQNGALDILSEQVFKSTIVELQPTQIVLRLRSRQKNQKIFNSYEYWHVEHDRLDNNFTAMSRSIYEFATHPKSYRDLILQRNEPKLNDDSTITLEHISQMTQEQNKLYQEIIRAQGYYLLWGPPGTGKTSIMLRYLTEYFINHTEQRLLLLAYTNRAVDEICTSIKSISNDIDFIRIGSRYSTQEDYKSNLLNNKLASCKNRSEVKEMLSSQSLYVGTIASVLGKSDLFSLISFDLVMVDEASQILDSQLIGLLGRFKKFILIGDHKQLPAVTHQSIDQSAVDVAELQSLGITSMANSLFERMYNYAVDQNWDQVYGQLSQQGRMHEDLMAYANKMFYGQSLKVLSNLVRLTVTLPQSKNPLRSERLLYINTRIDEEGSTMKINNHEAEICFELLRALLIGDGMLKENLSIGIITPYRAQIACIRHLINQIDHPAISQISIDTVERYQGSARDIIILSTCMNYPFQMRSLQSLSQEGIDRKLNVAFTRAKEQFILIGNQTLLEKSENYKELISRSYKLEAKDLVNS